LSRSFTHALSRLMIPFRDTRFFNDGVPRQR
jgi:hypothetical protein